MDERNAVRGQGFTLMVFGGLVALCSVFFILGMVVGRGQGTPAVEEVAEVMPAGQPAVEEDVPELEFYDTVRQDEVSEVPGIQPPPPPVPEPPALEPAAPAVTVAPAATAAPDPPQAGAIMLQLGAFGVEATADALVAGAREQGFQAFILRANESGLHRVQLGPYSEDEAARVRTELEAAGFEAIIVR